MIAIISDIHSNIEALEAVLEVCEKEGVEEYHCLGDVIGYGPDPRIVAEIAMKKFKVSLMGNHEEALVTGKHRFNPYATQAIDWTRNQIVPKKSMVGKLFAKEQPNELWEWLQKRKQFSLISRRLMVHGSIYDPVHDYVDEPENPVEANQIIETLNNDFSGFDICFAGHNHTPFLATPLGTIIPHDGHKEFKLPKGSKAYICVGSVGQSRDYDNRSSFAILDGEKLTYHRVKYDVQKTAKKIRATGLHSFLADRLIKGI